MGPYNQAGWTLSQIITKVRNVTGTPSSDQLSNQAIADYINRYYAFTMPFELKEQVNHQALNFTTVANTDVYAAPASFTTDEPMAYANGYPLVFYQDRDVFFQDWPQQYTQDQVANATGNSTFTGNTQAFPVINGTFYITDGTQVLADLGNNVITQQLALGTGITAYNGILSQFPIEATTLSITSGAEVFSDNGTGILTGSLGGTGSIVYSTGVWSVNFNTAVPIGVGIFGTWELQDTLRLLTGNGSGVLNTVTGEFTANFALAPTTGTLIYDNYQAYQPARPQGVLFFNNEFTFRPIPDQVYQITMQGYISQIQLTEEGSIPLLLEWGELLALGASLDIFLDRGDIGSYNTYFAIFKRYENVALGRYVQQLEGVQSVPRF